MQNDFTNVLEGNALPLIPLRNLVLFPGTVVSVTVGRPKSVALTKTLAPDDLVLVGVQRQPETADPEITDLHQIATLARVVKIVRHPSGFALVLKGLGRVNLTEMVMLTPYWRANAEPTPEPEFSQDATILAEVLQEAVDELLDEDSSADFEAAFGDVRPEQLADRVASTLGLSLDDRVTVLMTLDPEERLRLVARLIAEVRAKAAVKQKIESEIRSELNKNHREAILRQQLKAIQNELSGDDGEDELDDLRTRLMNREFPEEAQKAVDRELNRLEALEPNQAEYNVVRNYLEWMADLPWDESADTIEDIDAIETQLDADHFGLEDVKERILEHMAVLQLSGNPRGTILCLAGPPGVGKTSLGRSVAEATGRPFVRIALGGVRDEAEIRGHRRTYVGSRPGRIVHALRKVGSNNAVMLLDEIDKLGRGWAGDPEAALLEVLDPEQNDTFQDHYLEVPFDLSKVLFITTANDLGNISGPLRDRLEIIEVAGYTVEEKRQIARNHLLPKQLSEHGIDPEALTVTDGALEEIIASYTREAGVRQLQRMVTKLCRSVALKVARAGGELAVNVDVEQVPDYFGKPKFHNEVAARTSQPGVATGLAWTPVGGDILFVETSKMDGKGQLQITGQLGDVMQESARAALTYVRSNAEELGVDPKFRTESDIHIHVPAGAVPKDGPSAGVTMFTALTSLLTGRQVRSDTAMTGEATLRGQVLPVGGIKAKVLAAHRAGIKRVILPERNMRDLDEVPDNVLADLEVFPVSDMAEALKIALVDGPTVDLTPGGTDGSTAMPAA